MVDAGRPGSIVSNQLALIKISARAVQFYRASWSIDGPNDVGLGGSIKYQCRLGNRGKIIIRVKIKQEPG